MKRIYLSPPDVGVRERELLLDAFDSNWIAPLGPHVDAFEREFAAVVERLHQEIQKVLALPAVREKFAHQGVEPMPLSPGEFDALIRREIQTNQALVKAANLKFN